MPAPQTHRLSAFVASARGQKIPLIIHIMRHTSRRCCHFPLHHEAQRGTFIVQSAGAQFMRVSERDTNRTLAKLLMAFLRVIIINDFGRRYSCTPFLEIYPHLH